MDRLNQLRLGRGIVDGGVDRSAVGMHRLPALHRVLRSRQRARPRAVHRARGRGRQGRAASGARRLLRTVSRARATPVGAAPNELPRSPRDRGRARLLARLRCDRQGLGGHRCDARAVRSHRARERPDRRSAAGVRRLSAARGRASRSVSLARRPRRRRDARVQEGRDQLQRLPLRDPRAVRRRGRASARRSRLARRRARAGRREPRVSAPAQERLLSRPLLSRALQRRDRCAAQGARAARRGSRVRVGTSKTPSAAAVAACCRRRCRSSPIR